MRACPGRSATRRSSRRGALQSRGRREHGAWYGPGSAERHEECRTASGTRALSSWNPSHMPPPDSPWLRHHRQRWLRHDAHLWIRPDAARFFPPGTDPAVINPTLPRKLDAAKAAAFEAEVAAGYRLLAVLREEVAELRAELKRRRAAERNESKYSPSQPRVPRGNPDGGQWTDGGRGASRTLNPTDGANRKPGIDDPRVISDSDPESVRAGDRYAQGNRLGGGTAPINGQTHELTPGQATRLTLAQARAEDAAARVRNID